MTEAETPPAPEPGVPMAVAPAESPRVGLVFRDGAEVVLDRTDERVADLVAVAGTLAPPAPPTASEAPSGPVALEPVPEPESEREDQPRKGPWARLVALVRRLLANRRAAL